MANVSTINNVVYFVEVTNQYEEIIQFSGPHTKEEAENRVALQHEFGFDLCVIESFYCNLANGMSYADALQEAHREMMVRESADYAPLGDE